MFRGHSNPKWELVPKAGRNPYDKYDDAYSFQGWKRRATEFLSGNYDDWDMLAVAQHYGLATRLLDWTFNPLVAAFFAVQNYEECDAVIYLFPDLDGLSKQVNWYIENSSYWTGAFDKEVESITD